MHYNNNQSFSTKYNVGVERGKTNRTGYGCRVLGRG